MIGKCTSQKRYCPHSKFVYDWIWGLNVHRYMNTEGVACIHYGIYANVCVLPLQMMRMVCG